MQHILIGPGRGWQDCESIADHARDHFAVDRGEGVAGSSGNVETVSAGSLTGQIMLSPSTMNSSKFLGQHPQVMSGRSVREERDFQPACYAELLRRPRLRSIWVLASSQDITRCEEKISAARSGETRGITGSNSRWAGTRKVAGGPIVGARLVGSATFAASCSGHVG